jgi:drug/metabolite transporter (DMT)-like permease
MRHGSAVARDLKLADKEIVNIVHDARGVLLKLGATLAFSLMYVVVKLAGRVPVSEEVFFRCSFALLPLFTLSFFTIGPLAIVRTSRPVFHVVRSAAGTASMFLNFAALAKLPLADITAFSFVAPIFAVVLAALHLREQVGPYRWAAVLAGFLGVIVMLEPSGGIFAILRAGPTTGAGLALAGSLLSAFVVIFIRQMSATERSETIVFYFMTTCAAVSAIAMIWSHAPLSASQVFWLICAGILGGMGQICMTYSYRYAEPSLLAPFDYVAMVWAAALGYLIFAEIPQPVVMLGAAIVVAAGLFIVWRERHTLRLPSLETPQIS